MNFRTSHRGFEMRRVGVLIVAFILVQLTGCLGVYKLEKPIIHYQLNPEVESVSCALKAGYVLRIMPVLVVTPYDGTRIMYSSYNFKIEPSVHYRWITSPGDMIQQYLVRSLKTLPVFANVETKQGTMNPDYVLEMRVSKLDCKKTQTSHVARFEADVILIKKPQKGSEQPRICFKKTYNVLEEIKGDEAPPDVNNVVTAMNRALKKFSVELQKDLCVYFSSDK